MRAPAVSRAEAARFARGFFPHPGRVRLFTKPLALGQRLHLIELRTEEQVRIVGQGDSWPGAYENMRANLPAPGPLAEVAS